MHTSVLIIGSGPAGYTAGIYATRAGIQTTLITGSIVGGQLIRTNEVENFPGFESITGSELMEKMNTQAQKVGVNIIYDEIVLLDLSKRPFKFKSKGDLNGTADTIIIATGASPKWLKSSGEEKFKGKGISICATCDGFFYKNKTVAVIGGGNSALYESQFLTNVASKVYLINKNKSFKGEKQIQEKVINNPKIEILYNSQVVEFIGENKLSSIVLKNKNNNKISQLEVNGVFEAIGTEPNISFLNNQVKITKKGYIKTDKRTMETSIKGVYACGDVQEEKYRQAIISAGSGAIAALSVEKFLLNKEEKGD